jgi:hypothetical protein
MDGIMEALAKRKTQWKEDLYFAMQFACPKLSKYYADVYPMTGMLESSGHICNFFRKLRMFGKWDNRMHIDHEEKTSYTTQY